MIRHVSLLTFLPEADERDIEAIEHALSGLPAHVASIRHFEMGRDLGFNETNASFVVIAEFDDDDGYVAYRDHPEHQRILRDVIGPVLAGRTALQYER